MSEGKEENSVSLPDGACTAADVAHHLRVRIQNSELSPGEWLREARLCGEFGVGRSIVRRALRILAEDGLIELEEHRGARVSTTTAEEVFDLYEIRAALYGMAARFACMRASTPSIRHMAAMIDAMKTDAGQGIPAARIIEESEAIFSEMALSASTDAQRMIEAVRRKTRFHYSYIAYALRAEEPRLFDYWSAVRAALLARDADAASEAARRILYFMQNEVARMMVARGPRRPGDGAPGQSPGTGLT